MQQLLPPSTTLSAPGPKSLAAAAAAMPAPLPPLLLLPPPLLVLTDSSWMAASASPRQKVTASSTVCAGRWGRARDTAVMAGRMSVQRRMSCTEKGLSNTRHRTALSMWVKKCKQAQRSQRWQICTQQLWQACLQARPQGRGSFALVLPECCYGTSCTSAVPPHEHTSCCPTTRRLQAAYRAGVSCAALLDTAAALTC